MAGKLNFTYFLGAGASANSVPIVKGFQKVLYEFVNHLGAVSNVIAGAEALRITILELGGLLDRSASVDTLLKKLYLSNDVERYQKYKSALSTFIYFNNIYQQIDNRYDLFFASLIDKSKDGQIIIPSNVNLISWNYDRLVEQSLINLLGLQNSNELGDIMNFYSNYKNNSSNLNALTMDLVKLNGSAGNILVNEKEMMASVKEDSRLNYAVRNVIDYHKSLLNDPKGRFQIQFSWEENNEDIIVARDKAKHIMINTDHLIVIGYSFPTFNRKLDGELLRSLKAKSIIHLQTRPETVKSVRQRLDALLGREYKVIEYTETDEFHIPYEYNDIHPVKKAIKSFTV
jgi:hypothetical protein